MTQNRHAYSFTACTANVLNLALPERVYYENQRPYSQRRYQQKVEWLGDFVHMLNPDILAVQEVWDEAALQDVASASGLQHMQVLAPVAKNTTGAGGKPAGGGAQDTPQNQAAGGGAQDTPQNQAAGGGAQGTPQNQAAGGGAQGTPQNQAAGGGAQGTPQNQAAGGGAQGTPQNQAAGGGAQGTPQNQAASGGAQGTPAVGFITRMKVLATHSYLDMPAGCAVDLPEIGLYNRFSRPPLHLEVETDRGQKLHVINVHLKSKRPKFLRDARSEPLEDMDDPKTRTRAKMRSLFMRAAEATALRHIIIDLLHKTNVPLILMGDVNDSSHSVTTQLLAETSEVAYDRAMHDIALFNAYENQTRQALHKDVAYSHIYQGYPEVLDQIFVSEEFLRHSKFSLGEVLRVDYFNDHLKLPRDKAFSDHGFVRAVIRVEGK